MTCKTTSIYVRWHLLTGNKQQTSPYLGVVRPEAKSQTTTLHSDQSPRQILATAVTSECRVLAIVLAIMLQRLASRRYSGPAAVLRRKDWISNRRWGAGETLGRRFRTLFVGRLAGPFPALRARDCPQLSQWLWVSGCGASDGAGAGLGGRGHSAVAI